MLGFTHQLLAAESILLAGHLGFDPATSPLVYPLAMLGALLPDIDHPQSKLGRLLWPLSATLYRTVGHRGPTHSFFFLFLTLIPLVFGVSLTWVFPVFIGCAMHLLADCLTPKGCQLLYPKKVFFKIDSVAKLHGRLTELLIQLSCLAHLGWQLPKIID